MNIKLSSEGLPHDIMNWKFGGGEVMTIEQSVVERVRRLPLEKQREVLDFAEFLESRASPPTRRPLRSLKGICADLLEKPLTQEEIDQTRAEMWGSFPREDIA